MTEQPSVEDAFADLDQLIAEFTRAGLRELHVRHGDFEIYLSQDAGAAGIHGHGPAIVRNAPAPEAPTLDLDTAPPPAAIGAAAPVPVALPPGAVLVRAPYLGVFYRSPKPGSPPYVEIGGAVTPESEICLVEVMKLFTAVRAGVAGRIVDVLAADGEMVAADQPLFAIAPE